MEKYAEICTNYIYQSSFVNNNLSNRTTDGPQRISLTRAHLRRPTGNGEVTGLGFRVLLAFFAALLISAGAPRFWNAARGRREFFLLGVGRPAETEHQMPKLKTKSGAKKRFKITAQGKVLYAQKGKRHGMIKRTNKQIRNLRGTAVMFKADGDNVIKYFLPNG